MNNKMLIAAKLMKIVSRLSMIISIMIFSACSLCLSLTVFVDKIVNISASDKLLNFFLKNFQGGEFDISATDVCIAFLPMVIEMFVGVFVFAQLSNYFKYAESNAKWIYEGSEALIKKIIVLSASWLLLPIIVDKAVMLILPSEIFSGNTVKLNTLALIIMILFIVFLLTVRSKRKSDVVEEQ